jgi:ABC-type multidrug transport system ATPase subunit
MTELLNVQGLSAGYGEAVVLHEVSLSLKEGQTLALLGRNGTGKTTLINTLAGATRQHAGTISLGSGGPRWRCTVCRLMSERQPALAGYLRSAIFSSHSRCMKI